MGGKNGDASSEKLGSLSFDRNLGGALRLPLEHEQTKMGLYTLGGLFVYLIAGPFELLFFFSFFSLLTKKSFYRVNRFSKP